MSNSHNNSHSQGNSSDGPDEFALKLAAYHTAIEQEFNTVQEAISTGEAEQVAEAARQLLISRSAEAAKTIAWLAENAKAESTRLAAAKYILDNALGEKGLARPVDPLEALVNELKGNDPKDQTTRPKTAKPEAKK